ncbi:hypothetical protein BRYFOR_09422 [Marvinbryantia formatexigens DSM 14469]|uniref:Uncharacterized protein n=1 Tax=Marvinbryantia formatexigens DSM 14469 TaxID=478749 RepID=C6LL75_9FIRM|nr:hypothetical protein BRYFOR_09422 [Marvinbryantia formatexigens DSM 14469]
MYYIRFYFPSSTFTCSCYYEIQIISSAYKLIFIIKYRLFHLMLHFFTFSF